MTRSLLLINKLHKMNTLILAGLVLSVVQVLKVTFGITKRYIPIVSILVMVVIIIASWIYSGYPKIPLDILTTDLVAVLTAMGLWSGTKAVIGK